MSEIPLREATRRARKAAADDHDPDLDTAVARLAALSPLAYDRVRGEEAERLGVRVATLDDEVARRRARERGTASDDPTLQGEPIAFARPEPWPEPVDGAALLAELEATFTRYLALPKGAPTALALWTLHTYEFERFSYTPRLILTSPEGGCGKSRVVQLLGQLVAKPLSADNTTCAALFRSLAMARPTVLIDEADTFLKASEELRGIVNSGHSRTGGLLRTVGDNHEPRRFSTWGPVTIASIGKLPATITDRAVTICMHKRRRDERVARFRLDRPQAHEPLARRCSRFMADAGPAVAEKDPDVPEWMADRAADNWRVLLAIAEVIGAEALARALAAARALTPQADAAPYEGTVLLDDIRRIFEERETARLASTDLVAALVAREDRPWPEWRNGQPLSPMQLAKLLGPYGIKPRLLWAGAKSSRGYVIDDFEDAFARYLAFQGVRPLGASETAPLRANEGVRRPQNLTGQNAANANNSAAPNNLTPPEPLDGRGRMKPGLREEPAPLLESKKAEKTGTESAANGRWSIRI